ncbi:MAG: two-component system, chemotaxis family, sensor kinase CheA [Gammaproteobacteria bacterium]|jgi:signal transduction histidine kinase/PAS domain-containing protein|nr:two-component system, chemotaxis family, sensor kinase CheA [Gammaproteobacteria bacterium]
MNSLSVKSLIPRIGPAGLIVLVIVLAFGFLVTVLVPGLELAGELVDSAAALKLVGEQQRNPTIIRAALESLHDRLSTRAYIQESKDQLHDAVKKLDAALPIMNAPRPANWFALTGDTGATAESIAGKHAAELGKLWVSERAALAPVLEYIGVPYDDSESAGTALNQSGRQLDRDVAAAIRTSHRALPLLDSELLAITGDLETTNARAAKELRLVMLAGLAIAAMLVALVTILLSARKRQEESLQLARQQTVDILRTVKDGLFLLDQNLTIGTAYSAALETLFQRTDFAGLAFESLLKNVVSERTLATALKFVTILWSERTNEKLVKSINPLGEVEVHLDAGRGRFETRYLQFEFHRVRVDGKITRVLVSVSDVSSRVDLARELQSSQSQAQAQVDTLLGILHIDPAQLASFLNDSNAAMKMINAVLREPAREEGVFRKKLDTLFRQAHAVKGEAAALGLSSIESRAHSFEEDLKSLREKSDLSGNDFLPLVIKLDDLLTHLQSVGELVSRLSRLQPAAVEVPHTSTDVIIGGARAIDRSDSGLTTALQQLAERVARDVQKEAVLQCVGFEAVPEHYRRIVKDISIQAVRNAIVHGIEVPSVRLAAGKMAQGQVRLTFQSLGDGGYKFSVEDDGQGLATDRIKEVALEKGFITPEQADGLDAKQIYSLLFKPGFSTVENATKDAGRGVGMNLVADLMHQVGGRVGVATARGRFTRLTVTLPPQPKHADDDTAAA